MTPHPQQERYIEVPIKYYPELREIFNEPSLNAMIRSRSHSSAQSEQEIRQDEREKVIKDIFTWLCDMNGGDTVLNFELGLFSSPQPFNTAGLVHKLAELRSKQGKL
jgi:hypothetical protein